MTLMSNNDGAYFVFFSCRCPQQIPFWFELTTTVLVDQGKGLLSSTNEEMTINSGQRKSS
jgi:hypothetical protein